MNTEGAMTRSTPIRTRTTALPSGALSMTRSSSRSRAIPIFALPATRSQATALPVWTWARRCVRSSPVSAKSIGSAGRTSAWTSGGLKSKGSAAEGGWGGASGCTASGGISGRTGGTTTEKTPLQPGQRACLPAAFSGRPSLRPHEGQMISSMIVPRTAQPLTDAARLRGSPLVVPQRDQPADARPKAEDHREEDGEEVQRGNHGEANHAFSDRSQDTLNVPDVEDKVDQQLGRGDEGHDTAGDDQALASQRAEHARRDHDK